MPIQVVCPGCKKRFKVSEKFAGKKGPCPACKAQITIPEAIDEDDVVVHAPENFGPADSQGRPTLKPIKRTEFTVTPMQWAIAGAAVVGVLVVAVVLRGSDKSPWILGLGAALLGPPLALAGYTFLRDDELEPYRGRSLWIRSLICGLCFALTWGIYAYVKWSVLGVVEGEQLEMFQLSFIVPPLVGAGAVAAWACYDLDFGNAAFCYGMYLGATVLLRLLVGLDAF